jgi:imidazolonepropionase-like amidohydrolase
MASSVLDAVVLPGGERRLLFIKNGRITFEPQPDARELAPAGGFVLPGLVDAHTHADFPEEQLSEDERSRFVRQNLRGLAGVGVLLLRDLGASSRTLEELERRAGEPRVIPACEALISCENEFFPVTAPDRLVDYALSQIRRGVSWLKVFVDFPDPTVEVEGKSQYFSEENPLAYDEGSLTRLVERVHAAGGRIAAHAFTQRGAAVCVAASVDTLEHGWGVSEDLFPAMVAGNIAWAPLAAIAAPMIEMGKRDQRPDQCAWIESSLERMATTLPAAVAAGVTLLTGTDWFPAITIADEIQALRRLGVAPADSLAAATTEARRFFGHPGLQEGAPADLVHYRQDPRGALPALPDLILLDGERVVPQSPVHQPPPRGTDR